MRYAVLLLLLVVPALAGEPDDPGKATGKWERLKITSLETYYVFPTTPDFRGNCPEDFLEWMHSEVGIVKVSCDTFPIFTMFGITGREPVISRAGPGVHPYLQLNRLGELTLRVAVTVPASQPTKVTELTLTADDDRRVVPVGVQVESLQIEGWSPVTFVSFNLTTDDVPIEFLRVLSKASRRSVVFGQSGKKQIKVSKGNAKYIGKILALYDALREF